MIRVFVSHPSDKLAHYFGDRAARELAAFADARYNEEARELPTAQLIERLRDCDVIIAYRQTPAPAAFFAALPGLTAFVRCAVDIRTVDVEAASSHGVLVTQASPGFVPAAAEWVMAVMIDLARGISVHSEAYHRDAGFPPAMGRQLRGATLGVIGYGQISRYLCNLALAFGMRVLVTDPYASPQEGEVHWLEREALLREADFVVCLAAATPETENLMNAAAFAVMKPGAFFINASRGETLDDAALLAALDSGRLAGAALDVGRAPDQMPAPALARHPRVIATPHIGGLTQEAIEHQALETVEQVRAIARGEAPKGAVNAPRAARLLRWKAALD